MFVELLACSGQNIVFQNLSKKLANLDRIGQKRGVTVLVSPH